MPRYQVHDESMPNPGGPFKYKVGQRVTVTFPSGHIVLGRIMKRTIEAALGKTYLVRDQDGRNQGYCPEEYLTLR